MIFGFVGRDVRAGGAILDFVVVSDWGVNRMYSRKVREVCSMSELIETQHGVIVRRLSLVPRSEIPFRTAPFSNFSFPGHLSEF